LKRSKLVQWALAYIAAAFAFVQGLDVIARRFGWPERIEKVIILALAVGFLVALAPGREGKTKALTPRPQYPATHRRRPRA
jgi:hypothetical protein